MSNEKRLIGKRPDSLVKTAYILPKWGVACCAPTWVPGSAEFVGLAGCFSYRPLRSRDILQVDDLAALSLTGSVWQRNPN